MHYIYIRDTKILLCHILHNLKMDETWKNIFELNVKLNPKHGFLLLK